MDNIQRKITPEIIAMSKLYPVVTITGPRQSGKTTIARKIFSKKPYVSLENPDQKLFAKTDPKGFLAKYPDGAILDEIQNCPEILSYLQQIIDEKDQKGMFILTGSNQLELSEKISQSLAGRTAILKLMPFSIKEIAKKFPNFGVTDYIFYGFYPRIYKDNIDPTKFYRDYVQTYIERDVRKLINVKDLSLFQRFLKLCAGRIGNIFNSSNLANELGVSHNTIQSWLSVLESSFVIFKLQPYFENFGKRIIKSPKIYFNDVGLACYLLDINDSKQILRDPLQGALFENLVIADLIKNELNAGKVPNFYFFRDNNGNEVDLIEKTANFLTPIEIKSSQTFNLEFLKSLKYFQNLVGRKRCSKGLVIYNGDAEQQVGDFAVVDFIRISQIASNIKNHKK